MAPVRRTNYIGVITTSMPARRYEAAFAAEKHAPAAKLKVRRGSEETRSSVREAVNAPYNARRAHAAASASSLGNVLLESPNEGSCQPRSPASSARPYLAPLLGIKRGLIMAIGNGNAQGV